MKPPALIIGLGRNGPPVGPVPPGASDGSDGGGDEPQAAPSKLYVPLASLATPDDGEKMQTPEVGDSGSMQVDYIVQSIEGDQACIKPTAVNGTPLPTADDEETAPEDQTDSMDGTTDETAQMGQQLGKEAAGMSQ